MSTAVQYDHREKAGNQGDICKHPALIAAVDETIARTKHTPFRYADIFAGYAKNLLPSKGEWSRGIGKIAGQCLGNRNRHVALWASISGFDRLPCAGAVYPGSALFAMQVCKRRGKRVELSLWETNREPFKNSRKFFPSVHGVFDRAAKPNEAAIKNADFVFIDPPDKSKGTWAGILRLLHKLNRSQSVLVWLPIAADTTHKPPREDKASLKCRMDSLRLGMSASSVRWANGGRTIGCFASLSSPCGGPEGLKRGPGGDRRIGQKRVWKASCRLELSPF